MHLALLIHVTAQGSSKRVVHGTLPPGSRLEFLAQGFPDRLTAPAGEGGKYSIELNPVRYEVIFVAPKGQRQSAFVTFSNPDTTLNAEAPTAGAASKGSSVTSSLLDYDLLADWKIVDPAKRGVSAKVSVDAELFNGKSEPVTTWVMARDGDGETEFNGPFETTPDGRAIFRIRESRLRVDRVVALRVKVEVPGRAAGETRILPVLEFSAAGHFHAVYPDQYEITMRETAKQ